MRQVHHIAIIGQPAIVTGMTVSCPHCNKSAVVREDGSALCIEGNKSFAPESTDVELFQMRREFDRRNGIQPHHRNQMVPALVASSGFDADPNGGFHPELSGAVERFARGLMLTGGMNRVYA